MIKTVRDPEIYSVFFLSKIYMYRKIKSILTAPSLKSSKVSEYIVNLIGKVQSFFTGADTEFFFFFLGGGALGQSGYSNFFMKKITY